MTSGIEHVLVVVKTIGSKAIIEQFLARSTSVVVAVVVVVVVVVVAVAVAVAIAAADGVVDGHDDEGGDHGDDDGGRGTSDKKLSLFLLPEYGHPAAHRRSVSMQDQNVAALVSCMLPRRLIPKTSSDLQISCHDLPASGQLDFRRLCSCVD